MCDTKLRKHKFLAFKLKERCLIHRSTNRTNGTKEMVFAVRLDGKARSVNFVVYI